MKPGLQIEFPSNRCLSMLARDCYPCVRWMELAGIARLIDDEWALVEGARLNFDGCDVPLLDV